MTARHFVPDTELALAGDVNFDLFDNPRFDFLAAFHAVRRAISFELQLGELVFVTANDFADPIPNRARIDLDVIVGSRQFSQKRFVILRLAGMMISPVLAFTTSSGIFSPSRTLESESVSCSMSPSSCAYGLRRCS